MDKISRDRVALLHPKIRIEVPQLILKADSELKGRAKVRIVQALRTAEEQNDLYAQGRTKPGSIVTNAKAYESPHNYGLAIDFCLLIDNKEISWDLQKDWDGDKIADWMEVVKVFRDAGYTWGGVWKFKDNPHFEKYFSSWKELKAKLDKGAFFEEVINGKKYKWVNL